LQALDPSRMAETTARIALVRSERERLTRALSRDMAVEPGFGPVVIARPSDPDGVMTALARFGVAADRDGVRVRLPVSAAAEVNDRLLVALGLGVAGARPRR